MLRDHVTTTVLTSALFIFAFACTGNEAIEKGTDCDEACPVGAQKISSKSAGGTCGADGSYTATGSAEVSGTCSGEGECQVVCVYPNCSEDQTLVITEEEYRCEASIDPCEDVDCDGHGSCQIVYDAPTCVCEEGYVSTGIHCQPETDPVVHTVTPASAFVGQKTFFTITGENLPDTIHAEVDNCTGLAFTAKNATQVEFVCTPSDPGVAQRRVYVSDGGEKLYEDQSMFLCAACEIDGECVKEGGHPSDNPCLICDTQVSAAEWTDNDGASCDDGSFCNGSDTCQGGACTQHEGDPCGDDGLFCNGADSCDEEKQQCVHEGNPCPNDGLWCNGEETCDEDANQCAVPEKPCPDDGLFCTGEETCNEDQDSCGQTGDPCADDGQWCNGTEACNENDDLCDSTGNPCPFGNTCSDATDECLLEVLVHEDTIGPATDPDIATWDDGSFVIVWMSGPDYNGWDVYARVFDAMGVPVTDRIMTHDLQANIQIGPQVATNAAGKFVVVWTTYSMATMTYNTYFRLYDAEGNALTGEIKVNTGGSSDVSFTPDVAMDAAGNFVVAWRRHHDTYYVSRYTAEGEYSFTVEGFDLSNNQYLPDYGQVRVAMAPDGRFGIIQHEHGFTLFQLNTWDPSGNPTGEIAKVDQFNNVNDDPPGFALAATADFELHIMHRGGSNLYRNLWYPTDLSPCGWGAYFGNSDNNGCLETNMAMPVCYCSFGSIASESGALHPDITALPDGRAVAVWAQTDVNDGDIHYQRLNADGSFLGGGVVNTETSGKQDHAAVASTLAHDAIFVWQSQATDAGGDIVFRIIPKVN